MPVARVTTWRRTVCALQQVQAHVLGVVLNPDAGAQQRYYYYHSYSYTYAKRYYRRDDSLVGGAIPVTPPRPATNGRRPGRRPAHPDRPLAAPQPARPPHAGRTPGRLTPRLTAKR